mmetsp:Transcript_8459/g.14200  ORF Transcript_8459/g.14200 Transcript_8459/m.14200 type:complete len:153 (+) Transcript_8459:754-1212(+)
MRFGKMEFARYVTPQMRFEAAILAVLCPCGLAWILDKLRHEITFIDLSSISQESLMQIGLLCGFFSLMGYMLRCFLRGCAGMNDDSPYPLNPLKKRGNQAEIVSVWQATQIFNEFSSMILPFTFVCLYSMKYLKHTFTVDIENAKIYDLIYP